MCIFCDAVHGSESECWYRLLDQLYCLHDSQVSPANIMMQIFERILITKYCFAEPSTG